MRLLDDKFAQYPRRFVYQSALAALAVLIVLVLLDTIHNGAVIAALGATAFIVFALPKTEASRARVVIPGYAIGAVVGSACRWLAALDMTGHPIAEKYITIVLAALAVGLAIFLMTITNTEHAPAAGVALGMVIGRWSITTVGVVMVGAAALCAAKAVLGRWLKNLA